MFHLFLSQVRIPMRNISYTLRNRVDESTLRFGRQRMRNSNTQMKSCTISPRLVLHLGFPYFYIFFLTLLFFFSISLENVCHVYNKYSSQKQGIPRFLISPIKGHELRRPPFFFFLFCFFFVLFFSHMKKEKIPKNLLGFLIHLTPPRKKVT